jgi:hypothetical protein
MHDILLVCAVRTQTSSANQSCILTTGESLHAPLAPGPRSYLCRHDADRELPARATVRIPRRLNRRDTLASVSSGFTGASQAH